MGRFFIIAGAVVVGLVLAPVVLLSLRHEDSYEGKVVYHSSFGAKVRSIDPATCGDTTSAAVQGNVYEALFGYHYLKRPAELVAQLAESLAAQNKDQVMKERLEPVAKALEENEAKITEELLDAQGNPVDLGGYYMPDEELAVKAMRPSATFNAIIDDM